MTIAIVDDEQQEIDSFLSVIKEYSLMANVEIIVSAFHSAEEFIEGYRPLAYTAVFMDIFMSGMSGVDAAKKILDFTSDRQDISIPYTEIMYIRTAERNYLEVMQAPDKSYKTRLPFAGAQAELSKDKRFITITRGVIVNTDFVVGAEGQVCIMEDGEKFPIASNNSGDFKNIWQNYQLDSLRNERQLRRKGQ